MGQNLQKRGEFTKRAFLNGRIDLSQAEAVIDIINSKTEKESKTAVKQLDGGLSKEVGKIKKKMLDIMSQVEANIDYPEYDVEEITSKELLEKLNDIDKELKVLENSFENGKIIKEGIIASIIGRPNTGKSSLLNKLLKEERAIVTAYEGTTRDTIEEYININGIPFKIIDTAGIRETKEEVEKIGIDRAKKIAKEADLNIAIFDISKELNEEDRGILELLKNKKSIIILNKIDLAKKAPKTIEEINCFAEENGQQVIMISAKENEGIDILCRTMGEMFNINDIDINDEIIVTNLRHKEAILKARDNLREAIMGIDQKMPIDLVAINMKNMLENLLEIIGENISEEIVKEIFSKFCLGK